MNSFTPLRKYLFLVLFFNSSIVASAQEATPPPCSASFDILDGQGIFLGSVSGSGQEINVCITDFLVLNFFNTSSPTAGSTIESGEWNLGGSIIGNLNSTQYQFGTDGSLNISITITDQELCTDMASAHINVLGLPEFEYDVDVPSCFGSCNGSLSGTYMSPNASLYTHTWFLNGVELVSGNLALSACAGDYTVVVTDDAGCTNTPTNFTVPETPAVEVSISPAGPIFICPGEGPLELTANVSSAMQPLLSTVWSWSDGLTAPDQLVTDFIPNTNNLNQTLDINVVDANGCAGSASISLMASSASISGNVEIDGMDCNGCVVECYKMGEAGAWSPYTGNPTNVAGSYSMPSVPGLTECLLRMVPPAAQYPNMPAMYYPATHNWVNSTSIFTSCGTAMQKSFSVSSPSQMNGSTTIEGGVFYQSSGKTQAEIPIPGVDVVVEKVPPGNARSVVTTDVDGRFVFSYVEQTLGDTVYSFYVDLPGLPMSETHILSVGANDVLITGVNYCVVEDTSEIVRCNLLSVSQQSVNEDAGFAMFPNPAHDKVWFTISGGKFNPSDVTLIDITGREVRKLRPETRSFELDLQGLTQGLYTAVVRLMDGKVLSERLVVGR